MSGLKGCKSPIIEEKELIEILKAILNKFLSNKEEMIADLLEKYKKDTFTRDFDIEISKLEDNIKSVHAKKDKLLELAIKNLLSDEEFHKRNEGLNKEIEDYNKKIKEVKEEKENVTSIEENMKQIEKALEKEIKIEESIEDLIKLLVDKIYVSKIDNDRKHIKLEIYFKIGEPITLEGNLNKKAKQEYIIGHQDYQSKNNNTYDCSIKENDYQSCNNDIYNCARRNK